MSLYFVTGKIGSGKSYRGLVTVRRELLQGRRLIVTNLPLDLAALDEYMRSEYPNHDIPLFSHWREAFESEASCDFTADGKQYRLVDGVRMVFVPSRIRILADNELKEFYLYRHVEAGLVPKLKPIDKYDPACLDFRPWGKSGKFQGGVVYLLDECQLFYNVRKYADAPDEMPFYLSQHRKLGDDIYALTQKPENVDKMFRSFTEEFLYLTNVGKKRLWCFQAPKFFRMAAYPQMFTGAAGQSPEWTLSFRMDFKLANCYETARGIGIEAADADKATAPRGISWRWALLFPILLALMFPAYTLISKHVAHKFLGQSVDALAAAKHPTNHLDGGMVARNAPAIGNEAHAPVAVPPSSEIPKTTGRAGPVTTPRLDPKTVAEAVYQASEFVPTVSHDVFFVGVMTTPDPNGRLVTTVVLSDKSVYVLGVDKELTSVTAKYCIVGGVMYVWRSYDQMAEDVGKTASSPFGKPNVITTPFPPAVGRLGGAIVGGAPRPY